MPLVLWGGFGLSIYAVCVAHATDVLDDPTRIIPTTSTLLLLLLLLLLLWALGSAVGPFVASLVMQFVGAGGLFAYAGICAMGCAAFVGHRLVLRARPPEEERKPFVNMPASSPAIPQMDPRSHG